MTPKWLIKWLVPRRVNHSLVRFILHKTLMTLPFASDSRGLLVGRNCISLNYPKISKDFLNPVASAKHVSNCPIIYYILYIYMQCSYLEYCMLMYTLPIYNCINIGMGWYGLTPSFSVRRWRSGRSACGTHLALQAPWSTMYLLIYGALTGIMFWLLGNYPSEKPKKIGIMVCK